jgi:hypothetical protein
MSALRLLFVLSYVAVTSPAMAQGGPLSVCQMLSSAPEKQEITVRGAMIGEPHHGYALSDGIGDEPCPGWPKWLFTRPSVVGFAIASSFGVHPTDDQERLNREFVRHLSALSGGHTLKPYWVTLKGVLAQRPWLRTFRHADGTYSCFGAGNGMDCFGVFVLRSIVSEGN